MANTVKMKRSATPGKIPTTTALALGELAVNTNDGKLFMKKSVSGVESIVDITAGNLGDFFGDGSDGTTTYNSPITLTRDVYLNNLTVTTGASINTNGYRMFIAGTLDISTAPAGAFYCNGYTGNTGGNGGIGAGGALGASLSGPPQGNAIGVPAAGLAGTAGTTSGGTPTTPTVAFNYYTAGLYVTQAGAPGGNNGASLTNGAVATVLPRFLFHSGMLPAGHYNVRTSMGEPLVSAYAPGGGGGLGPVGGGGGGGGGGGTSGGSIQIYANIIARGANTNTGIFQVKGGAGGAGGNGYASSAYGGGGGGGSGGSGGLVVIFYNTMTGSTIANAIDVSGGAGGKGGNGGGTYWGGKGGPSGASGLVYLIQYPNLTRAFTNYVAGAQGSAPSTITGGNGAAANTKQAAL